MNPLEAMAGDNPLFDPQVQRQAAQMGHVLAHEIIPPGWDCAECVIGPVQGPGGAGLGYTVSREGVPDPGVNVNQAFHFLSKQLHDYWWQRWRRPMPPVRIRVATKSLGGWGVEFNILGDSAARGTPPPSMQGRPTQAHEQKPWWKFW